jgi:hypothetical protein
LQLPKTGGKAFKGEFYWQRLASLCGAKPWSLRLSLPWVHDFIFGAESGRNKKLWKLVPKWRSMLQKMGLDKEHLRDSLTAKKWGLKRKHMGDPEEGHAALSQGISRTECHEATPEFAITVPAAIALLSMMQVFVRMPGHQVDLPPDVEPGHAALSHDESAKTLLGGLIEFVCKDKVLRLGSEGAQVHFNVCNGFVDMESLHAELARCRERVRIRTSFLSC